MAGYAHAVAAATEKSNFVGPPDCQGECERYGGT